MGRPAAGRIVLVPPPGSVTRLPGAFRVSRRLKDLIDGYALGGDVGGVLSAFVDSHRIEHPQGYRLSVRPDEVEVIAGSNAGLFYAMMTLRQLLRQPDHAGRMPCLEIEDWPALPVRGVMLDISRDRVPTMPTLKTLIDLWGELKLNQVQLYTEHTFAYPGHEIVWRDASPLTGEEIEELDRYCRDRAIELVANQNSFGHMERWLRHAPYRHLADATGPFVDPWGGLRTEPTTLNPLDPGSIRLLAGLYDELLPHFRSDTINVGADEPIDLGHGRSREACQQRGVGRVYMDFLLKVHELLSGRGKVMQFCGDIILNYPELIREIPRGVVALDWGYEADHPFARECRAFAEAGVPFHVCPGTGSWNSLGGRWDTARSNIQSAVRAGVASDAAGFLLTDWGDNGHWQQLPVSYPAYLYGSALSWHPGCEQHLDLAAALSLHLLRDATGRAARALLALGEVCRNDPVSLPNATALAVVMLLPLQPYHREALQRLRGYEFSPEHSQIREALQMLSGAEIRANDGQLLREELDHTARLMEHAATLGRERFATANLTVAEIPDRRRRALAEELQDLCEGHRRLWLARSRPGGLADSVGRMIALRDTYLGN